MSDSLAEQAIRQQLGETGGWKKGAKNVDELTGENRELRKKVNIDRLTGLATEYPFEDMINGLQKRWEKDYKKGIFLEGTFIAIDMDNLHEINRDYGERKGGDDFFRAVGRSLIETARKHSFRCFRDGRAADSFVVYLPGKVSTEGKDEVIKEINEQLKDFEKKDKETYPGIKYGLSYSEGLFHQFCSPKEAYTKAYGAFGGIKEKKQLKLAKDE